VIDIFRKTLKTRELVLLGIKVYKTCRKLCITKEHEICASKSLKI